MNQFTCLLPSLVKRCEAFTLVELLVVIVIIGLLAGLAIPGINMALDKARRAESSSNLKQIGVGLINYAGDNNNWLPAPRATLDDGSRVMWQVAISPYMEGEYLDTNQLTKVRHCPVWERKFEKANATASAWDWNQFGYGMSFVMVGSPSRGWPGGAAPNANLASTILQVDEPATTVMVASSGAWHWGVHAQNISSTLGASSSSWSEGMTRYNGEGLYLFADGHVEFIDGNATELDPYLAH